MIKSLPYVALIAFGFFDYVGYNLSVVRGQTWLAFYRVLQVVFQILLVAWLCRFGGTWTTEGFWRATCFMFLWWCFVADFIYYFFYWVLHWFNVRGEGGFGVEVLGDQVVWAWWTPLGLLLHGGKREVISGQDLILQAGIGVAFSILTLMFR